jgi:hypothetical protein
MGEDSSPAKELAGLVPSVYYDLIARVLAGAPFALAIAWTEREDLIKVKDVPGAGSLLILLPAGASYLCGILLTPICGWTGLPVQMLFSSKFDGHWWMPISVSRTVSDWLDEVGLWNPSIGATLAKMQAEAVLCENLCGGYLLALAASGPLLSFKSLDVPVPVLVTLGILLFVAVCHRETVFLYRLVSYHERLIEARKKEAAAGIGQAVFSPSHPVREHRS